MKVLGIDPGVSGALAILGPEGPIFEPMPMVGNRINVEELLCWLKVNASDIDLGYVEVAQMRARQGVKGTATVYQNYGTLLTCLQVAKIPHVCVQAQRWTKFVHSYVGAPTSMDSKSKNRLALMQIFPGVDVKASDRSRVPHSGMTDALLIAWYGMQQLTRGDRKLSA